MTTTAAGAGSAADQRHHILATALDLMSAHGAPDTSMRHLADACGLNVATLYHYFPSKDALVHAVIEDRRYLDRLAEDVPPADPAQPPRERLDAMLRWLWRSTLREEALVRLILGESLRGEPAALDTVTLLFAAMETWFEQWLVDFFPELVGDKGAMARVLRGQVIAWIVEGILVPPADREASFDRRASELAALFAAG
ncbi:MAG: TetR/AcrR family transcriptional regulator [Acidimicrobiales bacterium]|nr:TetR/AcrR family transcriptional regulator [Acidimicrobiales bacterium]MCB1014022.1 TetR/AcrR family transcriptional regulator [Acidimicrobiales bacterium]MCB9371645.1 TetR/AcrR family transcriptional regulator [Microthrixaceae bacterium]